MDWGNTEGNKKGEKPKHEGATEPANSEGIQRGQRLLEEGSFSPRGGTWPLSRTEHAARGYNIAGWGTTCFICHEIEDLFLRFLLLGLFPSSTFSTPRKWREGRTI